MDNYKEKYEKAIERAKKLQETCDSTAVVGWCEYIFPELKESEDERIRKALIDFFDISAKNGEQTNGVYDKDILAWLEKQGEQKPIIWSEEDEKIRKNCIHFLELQKQHHAATFEIEECIAWLEKQVPVDKEEDEKIREELIEFVKSRGGFKQEYIAWLEKQGQVKESLISQQENKTCKENNDSLTNEDEKMREELIAYFKNLSDVYSLEPLEINLKKAIAWIEKQGMSYTKKDVDDAYLKGVADTKNEIEKQYEANYQIRKDIATFIFNYRGDIKDRAKWMNYLGIKVSFFNKGQSEQETLCDKCKKEHPSNSCQDITELGRCVVEHEQKPADKVEPKFHEGDWITNGEYTWKIVEVKPLDYILQSQDGNIVDDSISYVDKQFHSFTISDAKNGDVLCVKYGNDELPFIFTGKQDDVAYCALNSFGEFVLSLAEWLLKISVLPATKEQRDQLEKAMADAGYKWNKEELKLEKI